MPKMKPFSILLAFWVASSLSAAALDLKAASTERFKVSYVEPEKIPEMKELPEYYPSRDEAIKEDQEAAKRGESEEDRLLRRQLHFRDVAYPIRVTDKTTGIVYEVAKGRRTITATTPKGDVLWKVNPFEEAKLEPYRVKHPVICYFGKIPPQMERKGELMLGVGFNSSQFGSLNLANGRFRFEGQD